MNPFQKVINQEYTSFVANVVAHGVMRDGITSLSRQKIKQLYPIYYAEMLNNELPIQKKQKAGLDGWFSDTIKKATSWPVDVVQDITGAAVDLGSNIADVVKPVSDVIEDAVKNPAGHIIDLVTIPLKIVDPKTQKKVENVLMKTPIAKAINAPSKYMIEHPKVAMALATAASIAIPQLRIPVMLGTKRYNDIQMEKANRAAVKKIKDMVAQAEVSGQFVPPADTPLQGDPQEILALINSPGYFTKIKNMALTTLIQLGYDPNAPATELLAEKVANANIAYMKEKLAKQYPNGLPSTTVQSKSILPLAAGAAALALAFM